MNTSLKSDYLGSIASGLCLVHCLLTPIIFVAKTCSKSCCHSAPSWWSAIDYIFLVISLFAVIETVKNTNKAWMKYAISFSWVFLCFAIFNEKFEWLSSLDFLVYVPAFLLIALHLYNLKYCKCKEDSCCV